MQKTKIALQASERLVFKVAGHIYSANLALGKVADGEERKWIGFVQRATPIPLSAPIGKPCE